MERISGYHQLEQRYFERMDSSIGDKRRLIQHLPPITDPANPPHILDVGAGSGLFAHVLSQIGYNVTALDSSEEAINQITFRYNDLNVLNALANQVHQFSEQEYDVIICSSILHEVFSYGDNVHSAGHISSLVRALQSFHLSLKEGGLLLIRDGVKPANWDADAEFTLINNHDNSDVELYLQMCPFSNGTAYGEQGSLIQLENTVDSTWKGNVQSVMEFAYTYTWGTDSYSRETQEIYAPLTLDEYEDLLNENNFDVLQAYSYFQQGYGDSLKNCMDLRVQDEDSNWFDTNAIWVAQKR